MQNHSPTAVDPRLLSYFDWLRPRPHPGGYRLWVFAGIVLSSFCIASYSLTGIISFVSTFLPLALGIIAVPIAIRLGYKIVTQWEQNAARFVVADQEEFREWFGSRIVAYLRSWDVPALGVLYFMVALLAFRSAGAFNEMSALGLTIAIVVLILSSFCCGVGIATIIRLASIVWSVGRYPVEVSSSKFGVRSTGPMLVRCYLLAGIVWCLYTSSAGWNLSAGWIPMLALAVPAIVIMTGTFILAQLPLHHRMLEYKRTRTFEIEELLKEITPIEADELTEERLNQVEFLRAEAEKIASLPEWPFGWQSLTGAFLASIGSLAPTLISFSLGQIFPDLKFT
jgi:hypothetical protein